jgi:hypothetical protein
MWGSCVAALLRTGYLETVARVYLKTRSQQIITCKDTCSPV